MGDDVVVGFEDAVREPVLADELPDVFYRIQFRRPWRQRNDCDVLRNVEFGRHVPPGLIDDKNGMGVRRHFGADQLQVLRHRMGVGPRHDETGALTLGRADCAKNVSPFGPLVVRRARTGSALCPSSGEFVLLVDPRFILKPDLHRRPALFYADGRDQIGEVFLKASMASGFCA